MRTPPENWKRMLSMVVVVVLRPKQNPNMDAVPLRKTWPVYDVISLCGMVVFK